MTLLEIAKRVKRGVALLDRRVPTWRTTLRKHEDQFDFADGAHCVLGTLEHYSARFRAGKHVGTDSTFGMAAKRLGLDQNNVEACGFDYVDHREDTYSPETRLEAEALPALWRAEFEK